jgi:ubiquinone/menaquinone biosynthesis C-methylase UbiE
MIDIIKTFDKASIFYDEWYEHPQGSQILKAELKAVEPNIPELGLGLEIGAGTGKFAEHLKNNFRTIICLDPSVEMLKEALERDLQCVIGLGNFLPFRKDIFHFTYMVTVIEFLTDPSETIREIKYANKGNLCILFINSESPWGSFYQKIGNEGNLIFSKARLYKLSEVEKILDEGGYYITCKIGTLTSPPMSSDVEGELMNPSDSTGVIIINAIEKEQQDSV